MFLADFSRLLPAHALVDAVCSHRCFQPYKIGVIDPAIDSKARHHEVQMWNSALGIMVQHGQPLAMGQVHPLRRHLSILISELNPIHFLNKPMGEPVPLLLRPTLRLSFGGRHLHCYQVPGHGLTFSDIVLPGILELHPNIVQIIIRYSSGHISRHVFTADELRILFQCGIRRIGVAVRHGSCSCYHRLPPFYLFVEKLNHRKQSLPPLLNHGH